MLQHVVQSAVPAMRAGAIRPLDEMFRRVRLSMVEFTAQDIYQICGVAHNMDTLGMMEDPDFMRGLSSAFLRSDQTVLSPFQINLITDTFAKANINVKPTDLVVPDAECISPETLLNMLRAMYMNKIRDERKVRQCIKHMEELLEDFTPVQLAQATKELAMLQCTDGNFMGKLVKRACAVSDTLSPLDISTMARAISLTKTVPHGVMLDVFNLVEQRVQQFLPEDYLNCLYAFNAAGPKYIKHFATLVGAGLEHVENMDSSMLTYFVVCFASLEYRNREHIEIYADSLVEKAHELSEKDLVQTMMALLRLNLLSEQVFNICIEVAAKYAPTMDTRNIGPVMDVCSQVSFNSDIVMLPLLDRTAEACRLLNQNQLGDILDIIATYPAAKEHPVVEQLGRLCRMRLDIMGPTPLSRAAKGLANLGYSDPQFYLEACAAHFRWGFKDYSLLEPILQGLAITAQATPYTVKILGSYLIPMCPQMSLQEVERANHYMCRLQCEDEEVFKALADRVRVFVREITSDMPQDLQLLLQRGGGGLGSAASN